MFPPYLPRVAALFDIPDDELTEQAQRAAASVQRLADLWARIGTADEAVLRSLHRIAKRHAVRQPDKAGLLERVNRMCNPSWWRRALRKRFQAVEHHQIQAGTVHRHASPHVSAKTLRRHERNTARLQRQMEGLEAVKESTGEAIPMPELIEASLSNPANRRKALMARIKGIEASANAKGHVARLLTLTCPSCMHPRRSISGAANDRYDGTRPNRAQNYLRWVWKHAMRRAEHLGITAYGIRTVEAHHDACPHWHILVFTPADQADAFANNLRFYALVEAPDEPGAAEHRFSAEIIDPAKGSATGYVAKYVSKNIDGEGVDSDSETARDGRDTARRQTAWARTWGIRQFQFFGVPPITPTRELYRVKDEDAARLPGRALHELHSACKANDYAVWLAAVEAHGVRFRVDYSEQPSARYRDEITKAIQGLRITGGDLGGVLQLTTRCDTWRIQPRPKAGAGSSKCEGASPALEAPWTRFNNSAPLDFKGFFPDALPAQGEDFEGWGDAGAVCGERPAPGTATRCRTRPENSQARSLSASAPTARTTNPTAQGGIPC